MKLANKQILITHAAHGKMHARFAALNLVVRRIGDIRLEKDNEWCLEKI